MESGHQGREAETNSSRGFSRVVVGAVSAPAMSLAEPSDTRPAHSVTLGTLSAGRAVSSAEAVGRGSGPCTEGATYEG